MHPRRGVSFRESQRDVSEKAIAVYTGPGMGRNKTCFRCIDESDGQQDIGHQESSASSLILPTSLISTSSSSLPLSVPSTASLVANRCTYSTPGDQTKQNQHRSSLLTFNFSFVFLWMPHHQCRCLPVEGIIWIWVAEELWQKYFKDIDHILTTVHSQSRT